jgi:hypothetical protein
VHRVLTGKPEGTRPLGRPRRRWEDNIKRDLQAVGGGCGDWKERAQDSISIDLFSGKKQHLNTVRSLCTFLHVFAVVLGHHQVETQVYNWKRPLSSTA